MTEEDARTKQDLLFEVSSLNARLSNEIIKNEQLQNNWNELKKMIDDSIIAINELVDNPNDEAHTIMKGTFGRVLNMMQELEGKSE